MFTPVPGRADFALDCCCNDGDAVVTFTNPDGPSQENYDSFAATSSVAMTTGVHYAEFTISGDVTGVIVGVLPAHCHDCWTTEVTTSYGGVGVVGCGLWVDDGEVWRGGVEGTWEATKPQAFGVGDAIGLLLDFQPAGANIAVFKNGEPSLAPHCYARTF